jgi:Rrf2 family nitric oxide-sensitive transcriptional repressor
LIAVKYLDKIGKRRPCSAKEISKQYKIPYDLLSKVLQTLKNENILESVQGINGGYRLHHRPADIRLSKVFNAIEGSNYILDCGLHHTPGKCKIFKTCTINHPLQEIQRSIFAYFNKTTLAQIV